MSLERYLLLSFPYTDKIFFETPISTGFWLESAYFFEVRFEWEHEVIHVFTDEHFENKITSLLQEYFCHIEDREV